MAIAFNAETQSSASTVTSLTFAHTCAGSDRFLIVGCSSLSPGDLITGVTFNGVAMTLATKNVLGAAGERDLYIYYLVNPPTGAQNVVVSASGTTTLAGFACSYTGVRQGGHPDAIATNSGSGPLASTITTVANNSWVFLIGGAGITQPLTAVTNCVARGSTTNRTNVFDTDGPVSPAGLYSLTVDANGAAAMQTALMSFTVPVTLTAATGTYTLTGVNALIGKLYVLTAAVRSYTLTGIAALFDRFGTVWTNTSKNSSTFTNTTKNNATFTNTTKNSSTWTNTPKT
jgi:hypothetical protein